MLVAVETILGLISSILNSVTESLSAAWTFITDFISELGLFFKSLYFARDVVYDVTNAILPSTILSIFIGGIVLVIVLRIIGRT